MTLSDLFNSVDLSWKFPSFPTKAITVKSSKLIENVTRVCFTFRLRSHYARGIKKRNRLFLRLGLSDHTNGSFRKCLANWRNHKTPALRFCVERKPFENEDFENIDVMIIATLLKHKFKMAGDCRVHKFLCLSVCLSAVSLLTVRSRSQKRLRRRLNSRQWEHH